MATGWLRVEQADLAGDKILDAAATAFVELGVSRAGMAPPRSTRGESIFAARASPD